MEKIVAPLSRIFDQREMTLRRAEKVAFEKLAVSSDLDKVGAFRNPLIELFGSQGNDVCSSTQFTVFSTLSIFSKLLMTLAESDAAAKCGIFRV